MIRSIALPLSRLALFIIFFWFGVLKVLSLSPASPMVLDLLNKTMLFFEPGLFLICFGIFEMVIGLAFVIPKFEKFAVGLFGIHFITTVLPLVLLPSLTWTSLLVPTMEGQYIIKNIALLALVVSLINQSRFSKR